MAAELKVLLIAWVGSILGLWTLIWPIFDPDLTLDPVFGGRSIWAICQILRLGGVDLIGQK